MGEGGRDEVTELCFLLVLSPPDPSFVFNHRLPFISPFLPLCFPSFPLLFSSSSSPLLLSYHRYFGGIVSFSASDMRRINGFPNTFWGWGGEDDEMQKR